MISPEYLEEIAKNTEHIVSELNEYLIKGVVSQIVATFDKFGEVELTHASINDLHKIMDLGYTAQQAQQAVEKYFPDLRKEVHDAFIKSAAEIARDMSQTTKAILHHVDPKGEIQVPKDYFNQADLPQSAQDLKLTPGEIYQLETAYRRTETTIRNLTRSTANRAQEAYFNACDSAYFKVSAGVSINKAITEAIQETSKQGVTVIDYPTGHKDKLEVAVARAVRTGVNQANANIVLMRCAMLGVNYVKVSEHYGARVTDKNDYTNHAYWQGKAYKVNWLDGNKNYNGESLRDLALFAGMDFDPVLDGIKERINKLQGKDFPDFVTETGYGNILGLCGVNCRHTFSPFYPDLQEMPKPHIDAEKNEEMYDRSQHQRLMERRIRQTKREIAALKEANSEEAATVLANKKKLLKRQLQAYNEFCKEHKLSRANWRITI